VWPRVERRDGAAGRRETRGNEIHPCSSARPGGGGGDHVYDAPFGAIGGEWAGLAGPSSTPAGAGLFESYRFLGFRSPAAHSTRGYPPWPLSGPAERQSHPPELSRARRGDRRTAALDRGVLWWYHKRLPRVDASRLEAT